MDLTVKPLRYTQTRDRYGLVSRTAVDGSYTFRIDHFPHEPYTLTVNNENSNTIWQTSFYTLKEAKADAEQVRVRVSKDPLGIESILCDAQAALTKICAIPALQLFGELTDENRKLLAESLRLIDSKLYEARGKLS